MVRGHRNAEGENHKMLKRLWLSKHHSLCAWIRQSPFKSHVLLRRDSFIIHMHNEREQRPPLLRRFLAAGLHKHTKVTNCLLCILQATPSLLVQHLPPINILSRHHGSVPLLKLEALSSSLLESFRVKKKSDGVGSPPPFCTFFRETWNKLRSSFLYCSFHGFMYISGQTQANIPAQVSCTFGKAQI